MSKNNLWTWGVLVLLTATTYFFSDQSEKSYFLILLALFTFAKVIMVALQYMELKKAHPAWIIMLAFVLAIYTGIIIFI